MRRLDPAMAATVMDEVVGKHVGGSVNGFVAFLRERAVVGLAIGFVIGAQMQVVVKSLIDSIVTPLFQLIVPGNRTLPDRVWSVHVGGAAAEFKWGALVYALLNFLFVVITIYIVLRLFKLDRLDKKD